MPPGNLDVGTDTLLSNLEQSIGIEGTELDAFMPDKELRIVLPRLKLEELAANGALLDIKPKKEEVKEFDLNFLQALNNALDVEIAKVEEKDVLPDLYASDEEFGHSPPAFCDDDDSDKEWEPESKRIQEPLIRHPKSALIFDDIKHSDRPSEDRSDVVDEDEGKISHPHPCPCCSYTSNVLGNLKRHVRIKHSDELDPDFSPGNRKRKAETEDTPETKKKRGRPKKFEHKTKVARWR